MYLKSPFNLKELSIKDFKKYSKNELCSYFDTYSSGATEDTYYFNIYWEEVKERILSLHDNFSFYLISLDWFDVERNRKNWEQADIRLKAPEFWVYGYYFLFIGISDIEQKLIATVLFFD
ncbi:hypothetical protein EFA69_03890 [Rufibacter immobilis]|uniref:Uncharacterized protein n=1 Tax=Rufibacter immobilis TaxID=1348778 RepID=A0A3M9N3V3_9BACT|nr:hypothetical protein [Rufibacter immobilis]RNI32474.1 hypothetical protein EFA69_03890 [Rufibacter immobilis]